MGKIEWSRDPER